MAQLERPFSLSKTNIIQHPTHPKHPLQELTNAIEFSCDGCHALGSGTRYNCAICEFDLHDFCASCPVTLSSNLHPNHPLHLQNKVVDDRFCDLCGDLVNGLFYSCEECEVDLHPLCTLLPPTAKHALHPQHILKLQPEKPSWCAVCRQVCNLWRYRCNTCCLDIHPECVLGSPDVSDNESETRAVVEKPSQAQPPPGSYKDASGQTTREMVVLPVQGTVELPHGKYDGFSSDVATRALVAQPYQMQPPPRYDVFASDSPSRALITQPSEAQLLAGSFNVPSGLTTRRMVAPAVQPSSGYSVGVPFGGLPMQMNPVFYMGMMQPMMYYQGQGANPVAFGMQGTNYQGVIYHQGQGMIGSGIGMDQPAGSSNKNQGGDGKPKMTVKRKIYLAAKVAASVATLATTGVPLGLFLSSS
ncbi:hypothetical protein Leryth_020517 [Lithospermum erythrorhizon]|nr:hypothetical protein Leryth_020517 [Lithospermum erythrorhizon]